MSAKNRSLHTAKGTSKTPCPKCDKLIKKGDRYFLTEVGRSRRVVRQHFKCEPTEPTVKAFLGVIAKAIAVRHLTKHREAQADKENA